MNIKKYLKHFNAYNKAYIIMSLFRYEFELLRENGNMTFEDQLDYLTKHFINGDNNKSNNRQKIYKQPL